MIAANVATSSMPAQSRSFVFPTQQQQYCPSLITPGKQGETRQVLSFLSQLPRATFGLRPSPPFSGDHLKKTARLFIFWHQEIRERKTAERHRQRNKRSFISRSILFLSSRTFTATHIFGTMSLFYASPSDDNTVDVCESPAYGLETAVSSAMEDSSRHNRRSPHSPTERMSIIRKRMRSGKHKYSVGNTKPESTDGVDATVRAFAQSLKVNEIFSHDDDDRAADDSTATKNIVHNREAMATPPPAKRAATEGTDQHRRTSPHKPGELSPPPTPGRNHAAARSYHSSMDHPTFLPMGDRQRLEAPGLGHRPLTTMPSLVPGSPKVPSSLLDNYPQQANASYRIRPNFASAWLQDLINEKAGRQSQEQELRKEHIPGLPFAPPLFQQPRQIEHHVLRQNHQQEEEGSPKVAADMAVAPLPPTKGCFERANAA